ncbi:hypothetical protein LCGC14_2811890 [marine sediment metagenome]|uniref:Uncharacterized protein n=1 Tax=marine sediment metagenome TaxID=412755 RepID=A0A0F9AT18_9ZZZZ
MGYFSNGTEGLDYEHRYCNRCIHGSKEGEGCHECPVLAAHFEFNSDQNSDENLNYILGLFIPIADDKISNEQCAMFITKDGREHNGMPVTQNQGADQEGSG